MFIYGSQPRKNCEEEKHIHGEAAESHGSFFVRFENVKNVPEATQKLSNGDRIRNLKSM